MDISTINSHLSSFIIRKNKCAEYEWSTVTFMQTPAKQCITTASKTNKVILKMEKNTLKFQGCNYL